jgi:hypothetical protein
VKERIRRGTRLRRTIVVLALGIAIGTMIVATPAMGHVGGTVSHLWNTHIKPKADARYDRPVIKAGETVRGTIGGQFSSMAAGEISFNAQLPRAAPFGLDDAHVTIDGAPDDAGQCTGTSTTPTAPAGHVCIYPYSVSNVAPNPVFGGGHIWGSGDGTKWGFQVSVDVQSTGMAWWFANWAYKAPASAPVTGRSTESNERLGGGRS